MSIASAHDELFDLLERLREGQLDETSMLELTNRITTDTAAMDTYVMYIRRTWVETDRLRYADGDFRDVTHRHRSCDATAEEPRSHLTRRTGGPLA